MRMQQPLKAAVTVITSALVCAVALDLGAPLAQGAVSHKLNLEQANAKVAERAVSALESEASHQMLDIDPDGEGIRTETTVTCRRTGDHTARCPWRALAYVGAVTNLASRLADEATGGQVLIAQRLYAEVEADVEVEPVGELTLKGFQRPVAAFNVLAVRETASHLART